MKKYFYFMLSVLLFGIGNVTAQKAYDPEALIPLAPEVKSGTLPNGLKYYIRYNAKPEKKVELRMAVNAGSILEDEDQQGLAHFMEHMNFNGLEHFPGNELVHYLQSIGVEFGNDLNAYTGFDQTVYILPVPSDDPVKLEKAFQVIADWSGASLLTNEEIDKERGVILAESRLGKGADDRMMKKWLPELMNGSKYGERLPIGKDEIIEKFDYSVLKRFYKDWYRPNLQAVAVVGDMPVEEAEKMIIEKFGKFTNPQNARPRPELFEVKPFAESKAMMLSDDEANYTQISLIGNPFPDQPISTQKNYLDKITSDLLFRIISMRLDEAKNSPTPPFFYANAYLGGWARGTENFSLMAVSGNDKIKNAIETMVKEALRVKKFGVTQAELDRAKASMLASYEKFYNERTKTESGNLVWELVSLFLDGEAAPGIEWEYSFVKNNIDKINLSSFDPVREKINIDNKYFCYATAKTNPSLPTDDQLKQWVDNALAQPLEQYQEKALAKSLLAKEPKGGKTLRSILNKKLGTTTLTLENGVTVCLKPTDFKNDEIVFKGIRQGGYSLYEGKDYQSGQYSNNVVDEMGYGNFSNSDLKKFLAGKSVSVSTVVDDYSEFVSGNSTVKDLETMFQLLYLKSTSPRKDKDAFKSFISREKQQVENAKENPMYLFMDTTYNVLYQNNPRAHQIESPANYDKINMDNAVKFYKERIGNAKGMYYTFVGSFKIDEIKPLIEKYIGGLPSDEIVSKCKDIGLVPVQGKKTFTLKKGKEDQAMLTHYITGKSVFNADDNFYLSQLNEVVNNYILDTIREKMSAIYGGGTGGSIEKYPRQEYMIQTYFPCSAENIDKVDEAYTKIIDSVKVDGFIKDADWERVKEPALKKYQVDIKTNKYWLGALTNAYYNQVDPNRIMTFEQRVNSVTPAKLSQIARKFYTGKNIFTARWVPEME